MYNIDVLTSDEIINGLSEAGKHYKSINKYFNLGLSNTYKRRLNEIYLTSDSYFLEIDLNEIISSSIIHDEFKSITLGCSMALDEDLIPLDLEITDGYSQAYTSFTNDSLFKNQPRKIYVDEVTGSVDKYLSMVLSKEIR